jgi:multidrug efflux pump subunit AcrA (membrane-fusion protein)
MISRRCAVAVAVLILALVAAGCRGSAEDEEPSQENANNTVLAVSAARVVVKPMSQQVALLGTTAAIRDLTVRAPAAGRVVGLALQSGDRVSRGQVIAHIVSREAEAAQAGAEIAQKIDPAESALLRHAVKRYTSGPGIPVVAPENAAVAQRLVSPNQLVNEFDPLLSLVDPNSVYVTAQVPIDERGAIKPGMDASVTSSAAPGAHCPARVMALSPSFSAGGTTEPIRVAFIGKDRISQVGAAVEVHVTTKYAPDAIVIPAAALFQDAVHNTYYVFTVGPDGRAHRAAVVPGIRGATEVQVTQGLKAGDTVITSGGYALSDGLRVRAAIAVE